VEVCVCLRNQRRAAVQGEFLSAWCCTGHFSDHTHTRTHLIAAARQNISCGGQGHGVLVAARHLDHTPATEASNEAGDVLGEGVPRPKLALHHPSQGVQHGRDGTTAKGPHGTNVDWWGSGNAPDRCSPTRTPGRRS
jgi:hypothetical protein